MGDDEIDGGKGDDIIFGVSIERKMLLRGGEGDDMLYAGGAKDDSSSYYDSIDECCGVQKSE